MSRVKVHYRSGSVEAYKSFCEQNKNIKIERSLWEKIIKEIGGTYRDYLIESGDKISMPFGLGTYAIGKKPRKATRKLPSGEEVINYPVDWPKTLALGKRVYIMNDHSEGYFFGYIYFKRSGRFYLAKLWNFKACRRSSRTLAKYIKDPTKDYQYRYKEYYKFNS